MRSLVWPPGGVTCVTSAANSAAKTLGASWQESFAETGRHGVWSPVVLVFLCHLIAGATAVVALSPLLPGQ